MEAVISLSFNLPVVLLRDSWWYFTKIYIQRIKKVTDNINEIDYLIKALDSYNKYIMKRLGIRFESSMLYSKLFIANNEQKEDIVLFIAESINDSDKAVSFECIIRLTY